MALLQTFLQPGVLRKQPKQATSTDSFIATGIETFCMQDVLYFEGEL